MTKREAHPAADRLAEDEVEAMRRRPPRQRAKANDEEPPDTGVELTTKLFRRYGWPLKTSCPTHRN